MIEWKGATVKTTRAMASDPLQTDDTTAAAERSTVIAGYAIAIGQALEHYGVDAKHLFRAVGLSEGMRNDPLDRMTSSTTSALYKACVEATQDPYFGLTVARFLQVSNIHALGHGLMASGTLLDFCLRFERNFALASQSAEARVERSASHVTLRFRHLVPVCGESEDACLAFVVKLMGVLRHTAVVPMRVEFRHACPTAGAGPYADFFGVVPQFNQQETALTWPVSEMLSPLPGDCLEIAQSNDKLAGEYIAQLAHDDVTARVRAMVIKLLPSGDCNRRLVARALNMSQSSLHLKLATRATTFNALLNATRLDLARGYLSQHRLPIAEVASRLGFKDASNFARAFKRWTGESPSEHRVAVASAPSEQHTG